MLWHRRSLISFLCENEEPDMAQLAEDYVLAAILEKYIGSGDLKKDKDAKPIEKMTTKRRKNTDRSKKLYTDQAAGLLYPIDMGDGDEQRIEDFESDPLNSYMSNPEILAPNLLQKVHSFFGGMRKGKILDGEEITNPEMTAKNSKLRDKEKKVISRTTKGAWFGMDIEGLPDSLKKQEPEKDWRIENIWITDGNAEVDINMLWTNYSTVSFLGNMDSKEGKKNNQQKESEMWYFHVKKNAAAKTRGGKEAPEARLFNAKVNATEIFGKKSSYTSQQVRDAVSSLFDRRSDEYLHGPDVDMEEAEEKIKSLAGEITAYINDRLLGNHWKIDVTDNLASAKCKKLEGTQGNEAVVKRVNRSSFVVETDGGDSFRVDSTGSIETYKSAKTSDTRRDVGKSEYDVDDEYWEKEFETAQDAKFLYLFMNGAPKEELDKKYNLYEFMFYGDSADIGGRFTSIYLQQQGIIEGYESGDLEDDDYEWADPPDSEDAADYYHSLGFLEYMEDLGHPIDKSEYRNEASGTRLTGEQWVHIFENANENVITQRSRKSKKNENKRWKYSLTRHLLN